jgi:hypothetical protein
VVLVPLEWPWLPEAKLGFGPSLWFPTPPHFQSPADSGEERKEDKASGCSQCSGL